MQLQGKDHRSKRQFRVGHQDIGGGIAKEFGNLLSAGNSVEKHRSSDRQDRLLISQTGKHSATGVEPAGSMTLETHVIGDPALIMVWGAVRKHRSHCGRAQRRSSHYEPSPRTPTTCPAAWAEADEAARPDLPTRESRRLSRPRLWIAHSLVQCRKR